MVLGPTSVTYTPRSGFTGLDRFPYTLSDGPSIGSAQVEILVVNGALPSQNQVALIQTAGGVLVRLAGIPGRTYTIRPASFLFGDRRLPDGLKSASIPPALVHEPLLSSG